MKTKFIVTALVILLVANMLMMFVYPFGVHADGFKNAKVQAFKNKEEFKNKQAFKNKEGFKNKNEAFQTYVSAQAGGAGKAYEPMGAYDNVSLPTGNDSSWRYTAPNEPLMGPAFEPGPDSLFMFKNNQCKPECCGASFSCDGGCVCTSPEQRQYIASRGGNRTAPEDSA
jgi:hypothetical protein